MSVAAESRASGRESRFTVLASPQRLALAACGMFFLAGLPFVPHLGVQEDEALFAWGVYAPRSGPYILHTPIFDLPLMLMSYVGALKAWLYIPLFGAFGVSQWTIRIPMLAAGAATIWLVYLLVHGLAGKRAALTTCLLLALDPVYLLTICFDWGPVAFQHLLALGGLVLILTFWRSHSELALALAFFAFGLMLWDKALAIWTLTGLALAGICAVGRRIAAAITMRHLAVAAGAFVLGALPLIAFNLNSSGSTIDQTVAYDFRHIPQKLRVLEATADGSALFGWLNAEDGNTLPGRQPRSALQQASAAIAISTGVPRHNWMVYAFITALFLAPLSRGADRRTIVFFLIAAACTWAMMAVTANAGGGVQHAILLWPLPQIAMGVSFAVASRWFGRAGSSVLAAALVLLVGSNIAVLNNYYAATVRNGGAINWTDAVFPLSRSLTSFQASELYCVDWGIIGTLHLLSRGSLPLLVGSDELSHPVWSDEDRGHLKEFVSSPDHLFLTHVPRFEFFPGYTARLVNFAGALGYRRQTVSVIADTHGRPTFEVYRFVQAPSSDR